MYNYNNMYKQAENTNAVTGGLAGAAIGGGLSLFTSKEQDKKKKYRDALIAMALGGLAGGGLGYMTKDPWFGKKVEAKEPEPPKPESPKPNTNTGLPAPPVLPNFEPPKPDTGASTPKPAVPSSPVAVPSVNPPPYGRTGDMEYLEPLPDLESARRQDKEDKERNRQEKIREYNETKKKNNEERQRMANQIRAEENYKASVDSLKANFDELDEQERQQELENSQPTLTPIPASTPGTEDLLRHPGPPTGNVEWVESLYDSQEPNARSLFLGGTPGNDFNYAQLEQELHDQGVPMADARKRLFRVAAYQADKHQVDLRKRYKEYEDSCTFMSKFTPRYDEDHWSDNNRPNQRDYLKDLQVLKMLAQDDPSLFALDSDSDTARVWRQHIDDLGAFDELGLNGGKYRGYGPYTAKEFYTPDVTYTPEITQKNRKVDDDFIRKFIRANTGSSYSTVSPTELLDNFTRGDNGTWRDNVNYSSISPVTSDEQVTRVAWLNALKDRIRPNQDALRKAKANGTMTTLQDYRLKQLNAREDALNKEIRRVNAFKFQDGSSLEMAPFNVENPEYTPGRSEPITTKGISSVDTDFNVALPQTIANEDAQNTIAKAQAELVYNENKKYPDRAKTFYEGLLAKREDIKTGLEGAQQALMTDIGDTDAAKQVDEYQKQLEAVNIQLAPYERSINL